MLFALDKKPALPEKSTKQDVEKAVEGACGNGPNGWADMNVNRDRRQFMKTAAVCAAWGLALSGAAPRGVAMALKEIGGNGVQDLLKAINDSDPERASKIYERILADGGNPWDVHGSLFSVAQRVLNPPFINPHLPKMHAIYRELAAYLKPEDLPALVGLEIREYAKRSKLEIHPKPELPASRVAFGDIEAALRDRDREAAAALMARFHAQAGGPELARRLLLLGSGYLDGSLGHSVSCTAFMLREILERDEEDPWPALFALAHYFCEGRFHVSPSPASRAASGVKPAPDHMMRATSGRGIVNLHHTITFYALDRVRSLFTEEEYGYLAAAVIRFMGDKKAEHMAAGLNAEKPPRDYAGFFKTFSELNTESVMSSIWPMISSKSGRQDLARYLVKGVCDLYQGDYNPHFLTGLGSLLWVLEKYPAEETICRNVLHQYLDYYFRSR